MNADAIYDGIDWVWFDLDDTLFDFRAASQSALKGVYDEFRLEEWFGTFERWSEIYHRHNAALWERYNRAAIDKHYLRLERFAGPLQEAGMPREKATEMSVALDPVYLKLLGRQKCTVDGAIELLDNLIARGKRIGILSNGFVEVQYDKLRATGIDRRTDCVVLSDEIGVNKPDRRLFDYALEKSGASASRSLMVGDNPLTDIAGAVGAGWRAVYYCPAGCQLPDGLPDGVSAIGSLRDAKMVED